MSLGQKKSKELNEFNIPVPWGHIAVKAWGTKDDPHVLLLHGTSDNAGAFDNLMPHLPNCFYYICIDLPGHGRSSHFPPSPAIHATDYVIVCKLITDYFKKEKYIFLGHSLGGQIGYLFCRLYPDIAEKLIALDALPFFPIEVKDTIGILRLLINKNIGIHQKLSSGNIQSYTYEEILDSTKNKRYKGETLTTESAEPLLNRCLEPIGNGRYVLTTDERASWPFIPLHDTRYSIASLKHDPIRCPVLIIFAKKNDYPRKTYKRLYQELPKIKNIKIVYVNSRHDVHNKNPSMVAPHINEFLVGHNSKI